jgi:hypothetical protein
MSSQSSINSQLKSVSKSGGTPSSLKILQLPKMEFALKSSNIALTAPFLSHFTFAESRNELLPQYTCLSLTLTRHYRPLSLPCRYINFAIDTFIFPDLEYSLKLFFAAIRRQSQMIQSIVVSKDIYSDIRERDIKLLSELPRLNSLRIHLGGIGVKKELLVFDPIVDHKL